MKLKKGLVPIEQSPQLNVIRHRTDHKPSLQLGSNLSVFVYGQDSAFGRGAAQIRRTVLLLLVTATLCGIVYKFPRIEFATLNIEKNIELTLDLNQLEKIRAQHFQHPNYSKWASLLDIQEVRILTRTALSDVSLTQPIDQQATEQLAGAINRLSSANDTKKVQKALGEVISRLDSLSRRELSELQTINLETIFGLWRAVYIASQRAFRDTPTLQSVDESLIQARRGMVLAFITSPRAGTTTLDLLKKIDIDTLQGDRLLLDLANGASNGQVVNFLDTCIQFYSDSNSEVRDAMRNFIIFSGQNSIEPITLNSLLLDNRPRYVDQKIIRLIPEGEIPSRLSTFRDALADQNWAKALSTLWELERQLSPLYTHLIEHLYRRVVLVAASPNTPKLFISPDESPIKNRTIYAWFNLTLDPNLNKIARAEGLEAKYQEFADRMHHSLDPDREVNNYETSLAELMKAVYDPKPDLETVSSLCVKLDSDTTTSTELGRTFVELVQRVFVPIAKWEKSSENMGSRDRPLLENAYRGLLSFFDSGLKCVKNSEETGVLLWKKYKTTFKYNSKNYVFGDLNFTFETDNPVDVDSKTARFKDFQVVSNTESGTPWDHRLLNSNLPAFVFFLELAFAVWLAEAAYDKNPNYSFLDVPDRVRKQLDPQDNGFTLKYAIGLSLLRQLSPPNLGAMEKFLDASFAARQALPGFWPDVSRDRYLFDNYAFARSFVQDSKFIKEYGMTSVWHRHILEALEDFGKELKDKVEKGPDTVRAFIEDNDTANLLNSEHSAHSLLKLTIAHSLLGSLYGSSTGFYPSINRENPTYNHNNQDHDWKKYFEDLNFTNDDIQKADKSSYALGLGLQDKNGNPKLVRLKGLLIEKMGQDTIEYRIEESVYFWSSLAVKYGEDKESKIPVFIPGRWPLRTEKEAHQQFVKNFDAKN